MIVVDGSVLVIAVTEATERSAVVQTALVAGVVAPHLVDAEVGQALRAMVRRGQLASDAAIRSLLAARDLVRERVPHHPYSRRAWELRDNLSFYDALYVAVAEERSLPLLTADARLAASPGPRCEFELV